MVRYHEDDDSKIAYLEPTDILQTIVRTEPIEIDEDTTHISTAKETTEAVYELAIGGNEYPSIIAEEIEETMERHQV